MIPLPVWICQGRHLIRQASIMILVPLLPCRSDHSTGPGDPAAGVGLSGIQQKAAGVYGSVSLDPAGACYPIEDYYPCTPSQERERIPPD